MVGIYVALEGYQAAPSPPNTPQPLQRVTDTPSEPPSRPPTGGGTPRAARSANGHDTAATEGGAALTLVAPPDWRSAGRKVASGRYNGKRVRTLSAEAAARRAWDNGARTVGELVIKAGIGRSAASKYRRQFLAEISAPREGAAEIAQ
jgi:hypothetical protein